MLAPYDVFPYEYGKFPAPFGKAYFGGGTFDPETNRLFLTELGADTAQGPYTNPPVVDIFEFTTFPPPPPISTPTPPIPTPTATSAATRTPTVTPTRSVTGVPSSTPTAKTKGKSVDPIQLTPAPTGIASVTPAPRSDKRDQLALLIGSTTDSDQAQLISLDSSGQSTHSVAVTGKIRLAPRAGRIGVTSAALQQREWNWSFQNFSGTLSQRRFGAKGEIPIVGCQFGGALSTAVYNSETKTLRYATLKNANPVEVSLAQIVGANRVAAFLCADINGDRKDELGILLSRSGSAKVRSGSGREVIVYDLNAGATLISTPVPVNARPFFAPISTQSRATLGWLTPGENGLTVTLYVDGSAAASPAIPSLSLKEFVVGRFDLPAASTNPLLVGVSSVDNSLVAVDLTTQSVFTILSAAEFAGKTLLQGGNIGRLGNK